MDGSQDILSGTFAGRYRIERELGRGATATVYLARDDRDGRTVAIKVLRPELAASVGADRFLREIAVNERLDHPNVVPVLDSGAHDGQLFFVLPHMEGGSLRHVLRREKQLPVERAIAIAREVCAALEYAHDQGLIHRDVKPENILFSGGKALLADFGIARAIERTIDESTTSTGLIRGTPAYMSPEQASGSKDLDGRSDQFSLACVVYEMIAGVAAFIGPTPEAIIAQRFQHAPRKLSVYRPSVSPGLEGVIERALAISPADRYADISAFSNAVEAAPRQPTAESSAIAPRKSPAALMSSPLSRRFGLGLATLAVVITGYLGVRNFVVDDALVGTRYLVLPIDSSAGLPSEEVYDLLHQAFARLGGIEVVDRIAARRELAALAGLPSGAEVGRMQRLFGAGRVVRADLRRDREGLQAYVTVSSGEGEPTVAGSVTLPADLAGGGALLNRIAMQLLLDGDTASVSSASLPAARAYASGLRALRELNWTRADSLLAAAVEADATFAQASLWLAQARAWRGQRPSSWQALVERAQAHDGLTPRERRLANALHALAQQRFDDACREFGNMREIDSRDFVAWLGLGDCRRADLTVVRNTASPSGFSFRSDQVEAMRFYARGFELAPSAAGHIGVGAYVRMQEVLFADRSRVLRGRAAPPDTSTFVAYAAWTKDRVAVIPFPTLTVAQLRPTVRTADRLMALAAQRREFLRIARAWSSLLPASAGAKEAVAIALEKSGERTALDTIRLARSMARNDGEALRLAVEEVMLGTSLGRDNRQLLQSTVSLADSLLARADLRDPQTASILAPVAALRGRCEMASALRARGSSARDAAGAGVPHFAHAAAESLVVRSVMGCASADHLAAEQKLVDATMNSLDAGDPTTREQVEYTLLWQSVRLSERDSAQVARLARVSGNYHLHLMLLAARGDRDSVTRLINEQRRRRGEVGAAEYSFDGALAEARALIAIGDSVSAIGGLDPVLARLGWLDQLWAEPVQAATMVRLAILRAELASAARDSATAGKWAAFASTVQESAAAHLRPFAPAAEPPPQANNSRR